MHSISALMSSLSINDLVGSEFHVLSFGDFATFKSYCSRYSLFNTIDNTVRRESDGKTV
ncbi:MAG: hypothetical protein ACM3XP_07230 [Nitrososphaerales archaeon]